MASPLIEHLDRLREEPMAVRRRVAFLVAGGISGLVAIGWIAALLAGGSLALSTPAHAVATGSDVSKAFKETSSGFTELMGAASAAFGGASSPTLTTVDVETTSTLDTKIENDTDKTIIPF